MPKIRDEKERLAELVDAAKETFIAQGGYRRTQMADVARQMNVAPGTLYLYVEGKFALFELTVRGTYDPDYLGSVSELPVPETGIDALEHFIEREVDGLGPTMPTIHQALASNRCDGAAELERICGELYDAVYRFRDTIKVIEACSKDFPDLAYKWFSLTRFRSLADLERYLEFGMETGAFDARLPQNFAARQILESIAFWAMHRYWDPAPAHYDETHAKQYVTAMAAAAVTAGAAISKEIQT